MFTSCNAFFGNDLMKSMLYMYMYMYIPVYAKPPYAHVYVRGHFY